MRDRNIDNKIISKDDIVDNWTPPLECIIPKPSFAEVINVQRIDDYNISSAKSQLDNDEVLFAHETTKEKAEDIRKNGYKPNLSYTCSLRHKALYGWIFESDIGRHRHQSQDSSIDHIVFFKTKKTRAYVSSYCSSAYLLITGKIDKTTYWYKHVLKYEDFYNVCLESYQLLDDLGYNSDNLLEN